MMNKQRKYSPLMMLLLSWARRWGSIEHHRWDPSCSSVPYSSLIYVIILLCYDEYVHTPSPFSLVVSVPLMYDAREEYNIQHIVSWLSWGGQLDQEFHWQLWKLLLCWMTCDSMYVQDVWNRRCANLVTINVLSRHVQWARYWVEMFLSCWTAPFEQLCINKGVIVTSFHCQGIQYHVSCCTVNIQFMFSWRVLSNLLVSCHGLLLVLVVPASI